ncbi:MAG: hypothetical protein ACRDZ2_01680 [Ilumatobacteraceae bacterium]
MRRRILALCAGATLLVTACGEDGGASSAEFCADIRQHRAAILAPPPTADEIDDFVDLHRDIGRAAPLAIEQEWDELVVNYETASTVEPGDPESVQRVVETAVRTEESVTAVQRWVAANCEVDLGPVATMQAPPPSTSVGPSVPADGDG